VAAERAKETTNIIFFEEKLRTFPLSGEECIFAGMKHGMTSVFLFIVLALCPVAVSAEPVWLWPIAGQQAGEGIICQPGQRVGRERIRGTLYIAAPEGTPVVCPADAVVRSSLLNYRKSLHYSYAWGFDKPYDEAVADARAEKTGRKLDPRYICVEMAMTVDNRDIYIGGLRCDTAFAPGTMLHRGDTLGTVAYAYHRLAQPCISFSSSWYSMSYDPMTPFGLQSTFRRPHYWRTEERRLLIIGAVVLAALLIWLVFHIIYRVKDRRRRAYFKALMTAYPQPLPKGKGEGFLSPDNGGTEGAASAEPNLFGLCRVATEEERSSTEGGVKTIEGAANGGDLKSFPLGEDLGEALRQFEALPSARVLMEAAADDSRTLTADERRAILADISRTFADVMLDVRKSSLKVNTQELLLCMLAALHVPTALMADCLSVGFSTIRTRKTRLKSKMPEELFDLFFGKTPNL
jgi:hypothetical protein